MLGTHLDPVSFGRMCTAAYLQLAIDGVRRHSAAVPSACFSYLRSGPCACIVS